MFYYTECEIENENNAKFSSSSSKKLNHKKKSISDCIIQGLSKLIISLIFFIAFFVVLIGNLTEYF